VEWAASPSDFSSPWVIFAACLLTTKPREGTMEFLNVIAAAVGAFAFSAIWYTAMSKQWIAASGMAVDANGKAIGGGSVTPMIIGLIAMILVAGMMRHVLQISGIVTLGGGLVAGFGVGAFFITPWVTMNYAFGMRKSTLAVIDGVNAVVGCSIMGLILSAF
jgi:Protein of unknown function (DUF1761)